MIIKKLIQKKVEKNIETTTKEILEIPKDEELKIMEFAEDLIDKDDDPESYYSKGVSTDFDGKITWIKFDWLLDYLLDRQTDLFEDGDDDEYEYEYNSQIIPLITKYKEYVF